MAAVRDFDPTQINSDFSAILEQAGISFTYQGNSITGVWSSSRDAFSEFEDQRRTEHPLRHVHHRRGKVRDRYLVVAQL